MRVGNCRRHWTVSVTLADCTTVPPLVAAICTVETPAGVAGALGVVDLDVEFPPPHADIIHVPASKAINAIKR